MPLRDHFRSRLDDVHSWDELQGMWPAMIVRQLSNVLPAPYFAAPGVHLGTLYEIDVGTYESPSSPIANESSLSGPPITVASYAPPRPTRTVEPRLPLQDLYEVRVYDSRRDRRLVAAIELVSPSNKDRLETRSSFVAKIAALLKRGLRVSIVDVVGTCEFNLYEQVMDWLESTDPDLGPEPSPMSAVTMRLRGTPAQRLLDSWYYPLQVGQALPTLPIWLNESQAVSLDLESCYEETCRLLRIA